MRGLGLSVVGVGVGVVLAAAGACGGDAATGDADVTAGDAVVDARDDTSDTSDAPDTSDADAPDTTVAPDVPQTWAQRGLGEVRTIVHLHSQWSHDGCDNGDGAPNPTCVARLKSALCAEHIGVVFMTDHPAHMRKHSFLELLYADVDAGDVVLRDASDNAVGVRYPCASGQGGPDGKVNLFVGFEGTHLMGAGLQKHLDPLDAYGIDFTDETASADLTTATEAVRAAGGFVTIAHSEETDLSAETIIAHDVSAMELYNFHANFKVILGSGLGEKLFDLEHFVDADADLPDPDLTALVMLDAYPEPALTKWRTVSAARAITAFAGSDIHENASLPAFCADEGVCDGLAADYPNLVKALSHEGPVMQSDGERLDAYVRVMGWVQNRVLVPAATAATADGAAATREAFLAGKNVVVFEVLGEATGETLVARDAAGTIADMGSTVHVGDGMRLWARAPEVPLPGLRADWTDGSAAAMEAVLWRTDATGTHELARWSEPGAWRDVPLDAAGSYHLEVFLTPLHLVDQLGPAESLAHEQYRWVETNAIRVEP